MERHPDTRPRSSLMSISIRRRLTVPLWRTCSQPRGAAPLDDKERAQDLGRRLMLDIGPLVGMVQIPGIKYGVKDVVTLSTLNGDIEDVLRDLFSAGISSLEAQAGFLAQCLDVWLEATSRKHDLAESESLDPENVAYQGRAIVFVPHADARLHRTVETQEGTIPVRQSGGGTGCLASRSNDASEIGQEWQVSG